ncbi:branched-chain amino acid ABC transporter permease [Actinomadura vinacea]|uniref:Branched-chain amino acid ABC transporter permease n=1 Tax=Actinomadura vinacea TaxID=115336 RepID=A0ABN3IGU6_9ACTN
MTPELAQALVGALVLAGLYAAVGVGFVILYKATGVLNFAQGGLMLLGALIFYSVTTGLGVPWAAAIPLTLLALTAIGALTYGLLFRRLVGAAEFSLVIATLGLNVVLVVIVLMIWGPSTRTMPEPLSRSPWFSLGPVSFSRLDVFLILFALATVIVFDQLIRRSRVGVKMRAVADGPLLAALTKISVHRMSAIAWGVAALCAGVAGIVQAMRLSIDPTGIQALGLTAFPAVLLGGLDSIRGVVLGGVVLAVVQTGATYLIGGAWSDVLAYAVLLAVLLVRPQGFFGSQKVVRL